MVWQGGRRRTKSGGSGAGATSSVLFGAARIRAGEGEAEPGDSVITTRLATQAMRILGRISRYADRSGDRCGGPGGNAGAGGRAAALARLLDQRLSGLSPASIGLPSP